MNKQVSDRLIIFAILFFIPLKIKLLSYLFYQQKKFVLNCKIRRAEIIDAEGNLIATTIPTQSVYAICNEIIDVKIISKSVSKILNLQENLIIDKLQRKKHNKFVWIKRHITPQQAKEIIKQEYSGIYIAQDNRRFYPTGSLFLSIVGRVDEDNQGITGIEKAFNKRLQATYNCLQLSLVSSIQFALKEELDAGKKYSQAKAVNGIIISVRDGSVLAMYSNNQNDEINPHLEYITSENIDINRQCVYEMGSVFKAINAAWIIEENAVNFENKIFAPAIWYFGKHSIKDSRRTVDCYYTFPEAFRASCNVIHGKLTYELISKFSVDKFLQFLEKCGMFNSMNIDGLKIARTISQKKWRAINCITVAFGYGIAVAPACYLRAMLRIITGQKRELHILKYAAREQDEKKTIISSKTIKAMLFLLRFAFQDTYNEQKYDMKIYKLGGKTGTANKLRALGAGNVGEVKINKHNAYVEKKNYCSYFFIYPADDPKIMGIITIDEPIPTSETFGLANADFHAVPIAMKIIKRIASTVNCNY